MMAKIWVWISTAIIGGLVLTAASTTFEEPVATETSDVWIKPKSKKASQHLIYKVRVYPDSRKKQSAHKSQHSEWKHNEIFKQVQKSSAVPHPPTSKKKSAWKKRASHHKNHSKHRAPVPKYFPHKPRMNSQSYSEKRSFSKWYDSFINEQKSYCGFPDKPITITNDTAFHSANIKSWPWMVSLHLMPNSLSELLERLPDDDWKDTPEKYSMISRFDLWTNDGHTCSGTLISNTHVLTASHCVVPGKFKSESLEKLFGQIMNFCEVRNYIKWENGGLVRLNENGRLCLNVLGEIDELWNEASQSNQPVVPRKQIHFKLYIGTHDITAENLNEGSVRDKLQMRLIDDIQFYPKAATHRMIIRTGYTHDIAILKLKSPVKFSSTIQPICLGDKDPKNELCAVSGWGEFPEGSGHAPTLEQAEYKPIGNNQCRELTVDYNITQDSFTQKVDTRYKICARENRYRRIKTRKVKTKLSPGDSGGPLICRFNDRRWYQTGILSYGSLMRERENSPEVFTRLSSYTDWIMMTMWKTSDDYKQLNN